MKNVLIVGGSGFVGRNLINKLLSDNNRIYIFDIYADSLRQEYGSNESVTLIAGDLGNTELLLSHCSGIDSVIWLAHSGVPASSMIDLSFELTSNVPPLVKFLQRIKQDSCLQKFVYISTGGAIYKESNDILTEESECDPISGYGLTKLIAEKYVNFILKDSNIVPIILRPSNIFGRYQNLVKPQGLIGHALNSIILNKPLEIYGDGSIVRDYVHVDDVTEAISLCLNTVIRPSIFNVSYQRGWSINLVLDIIHHVLGKEIEVIYKPCRNFDLKRTVLSYEKINRELGWEPKVSIFRGIYDTWKHMNQEAKCLASEN